MKLQKHKKFHTNSIQDLINLTENLDCYEVYSDIDDDDDLGRYYLEEVDVLISIFALSMVVTKILVGALYDHFGLRVVTLICHSATTISFLLMAFLQASEFGKIQAIVFAVLFALAIPLETLVIPLIVNDLFGAASYDKILGICIAMNYIGYSIGCPLVNLGYDIIGSYSPILLVFGVLMIPTCIAFQLIISTAQKEKDKVMLAAEHAEDPS